MRKLLFLILLVGCGSEREIEPKGGTVPVAQAPSGGDTGGDGKLSFAEVQPLINTYCTPCHASDAFVKSSTGWFASAAPARTLSLNMPPPASTQAKQLSAVDRQKLLNFK